MCVCVCVRRLRGYTSQYVCVFETVCAVLLRRTVVSELRGSPGPDPERCAEGRSVWILGKKRGATET